MPTLTPAIDAGQIVLAGNSYVTLEQANTYFQGRIHAADWFEQDDLYREQSLLTAVFTLDERNWIGGVVREDQPLAWPRVAIRPIERRSRRRIRTGFETLTGATSGLYDFRNRFWASTVIPTPIQNAQCELAFALLIETLSLEGDASIKSWSADGASVTYDRPLKQGELPLSVKQFLAPLVMSGPQLER
jgi:hypothetical protein